MIRELASPFRSALSPVPCLGYVIRESPMKSDVQGKDEEAQAASLRRLRKLVLLGDTNDPDGIIPLVNSSPGHVALAVHEATDCYIPIQVDPLQKTGKNRSTESVHAVSLQRGHSTPHMAGKFANEIGARRLVLNHLGARYGRTYYFFARSRMECIYSLECAGSRHREGTKTELSSSL